MDDDEKRTTTAKTKSRETTRANASEERRSTSSMELSRRTSPCSDHSVSNAREWHTRKRSENPRQDGNRRGTARTSAPAMEEKPMTVYHRRCLNLRRFLADKNRRRLSPAQDEDTTVRAKGKAPVADPVAAPTPSEVKSVISKKRRLSVDSGGVVSGRGVPADGASSFRKVVAKKRKSRLLSSLLARSLSLSPNARARGDFKMKGSFSTCEGVGSSGVKASSRAILPVSAGSALMPGSKKRPPRSSEMVRSTCTDSEELEWRIKARETRITYDSLRTLFSFEEKWRRPDLKAHEMMMDRNLCLHRDRRLIGPVPGSMIGDIFFYRAELLLVGLHGYLQGGIDFVPASKSPSGESLATSIIVSGGYEDDVDMGDELIYTGQGGKNRNNARLKEDQQLKAGNLALLHSKEYGIEIRVIRGFKCESSPSGRIYVYDGLYEVKESWKEIGKSGFSIYKFRLLRVPKQGALGSAIIMATEGLKSDSRTKSKRGYISLDLSMKKEFYPIPVFNKLNDDTLPLSFEYLKKPKYPPQVLDKSRWTGRAWGCKCVLGCSKNCRCVKMNGGEFPYDKNGILIEGKPLVFECGPFCKCPENCPNRVTQKGITHRLEVYRSLTTGWGVRNLDIIRAGAFVCNISGVVIPEGLVPPDGACLVHPGELQPRWREWGDVSDVLPEYKTSEIPRLPELSFALDMSKLRNVGCYLSHSSWPNLFVQHVLYDHYNESYPHLMAFAMENIPPLTVLSIDYGIRD